MIVLLIIIREDKLLVGLMIEEWQLLERINEWNPQIEHQKVICGNIVIRSTLLERIKEAQKGDPMIYKWSEKVQRGELPEFCLESDGV